MAEYSSSVERFLNLLQTSRRGKFKIYIGMAAGVGKTYRMLQEAHQLIKNGVDIRIGYVETHKRKETDELVHGLMVIPRKEIFYKGHSLEEMDVDVIIQKQPEVVIIDELAHSNVPGSKNEKRWQDVEEILNAGISVISAVNIQHIESINAEVAKITGIEVQERIPDSVLRLADEVVNIDLTIDELIQRLHEGKIYAPDKVQNALFNFFKKDNLLQLRELTLKEVAYQVERKVDIEVPSELKLNDNILGCISENDKISKKVIRKTSRYAGRFQAQWYILYVETPKSSLSSIDLATQRHLINNFQLVTELGGSLQRVKGMNVADEIINFVKANNISVILIGRSHSTWLQQWLRQDLISKLQQKLKNSNIDLIIVT